MGRLRRITPRHPHIPIILFATVNLLLLGAFLWSRAGQATHVRVEASGNEFAAYVDGQLKAQGRLEGPARGGLALSIEDTHRIPSLPEPRGIDHVRVTDLASGEVLFEEDFSAGYEAA